MHVDQRGNPARCHSGGVVHAFAMRLKRRSAKSATAKSVSSGFSRCGAWPVPGSTRRLDRAVAFVLDRPHLRERAVAVGLALDHQHRHADVGERIGRYRNARKLGSSQASLQPRNAASTSAWWRASRARRSVVSYAVTCVADFREAFRLDEEMRRHQHQSAHAMILHAAGVAGRDGRAVTVAEQNAARKADRVEQRAAARPLPRAACSRAGAAG